MLILVTGKSGSGKTTFAKVLAEKLNYTHIDIDKIGLSVYDYPEVLEEAQNLFGKDIFDNGVLNKYKLGEYVFSNRNQEKIEKFRSLTWKYIENIIENIKQDNAVIEYILLPKTKFWKLNATKILMKANNNELRKQNIVLRDNISFECAEMRDKFSIEYDEDEFCFIFENNYDFKSLVKNADKVQQFLKI